MTGADVFSIEIATSELIVDLVLMTLLAITALAILITRHLFAVAMLTGAFSLLSAGLFVVLDAVDVAFTEAAVGAGISTVLMLGTLAMTSRREQSPVRLRAGPFMVAVLTGLALLYATTDMPGFGDPQAPAMVHVVPEYIKGSESEIGVPNIVTAVLASYRGYDTLGEVTVIFTAGVGVLLLLGGRRRDEQPGEMEKKARRSTETDA